MKKRFLAGVMAGVLMLGGSAFAQTSEEILFRGIPWGQKMKDGIQAIIDSVGGRNIEAGSTDVKDGQSFYDSEFGNVEQGDYHCYQTFLLMKNFEVAGYPLKYIFIDSVPDVVGGRVKDTKDESVVVSACYIFDYEKMAEQVSAPDELLEKLADVYGDPDDINDSSYGSSSRVWYGEAGTSVDMLFSLSSSGDSLEWLQITYSGCNLAEKIIELNDASGSGMSSSKTDGL